MRDTPPSTEERIARWLCESRTWDSENRRAMRELSQIEAHLVRHALMCSAHEDRLARLRECGEKGTVPTDELELTAAEHDDLARRHQRVVSALLALRRALASALRGRV